MGKGTSEKVKLMFYLFIPELNVKLLVNGSVKSQRSSSGCRMRRMPVVICKRWPQR